MRTSKTHIRIPTAIEECFEDRAKKLGYKSLSAYFMGLGLYDLLTSKPHYVTGQLPNLSREEEDRLHDEISRAYWAGETLAGSYFENRLNDAIADLEEKPSVHRVARILLDRIGGRGGKND